MKISVVIPMYNSRKTIISTLDSIKNQTRIDDILEIIVINDGSTDDSLGLVRNYSEKNLNLPIKIYNQKNSGVSSARNKGMKNARGNWIAFLDSDDEWISSKIERQIDIIQKHPKIDFLGGDFDNSGLRILWKEIKGLYKANITDLCLKNFPSPCTAIFKRSIYDEIGGFDESQHYAEDGNYFMKICIKYNFYHMPEKLAFNTIGKLSFGSSGLSSNLKEMYKGNVKNIKWLKEENVISYKFYYFLRVFYYIKYIRRIMISKFTS